MKLKIYPVYTHISLLSNLSLERRRDTPRQSEAQTLRARLPSDMRSVKSLDFDSETESKPTTESRTVRPTPPKKPLRLSLQRAQSLQTVELNPCSDQDRKRPMKRVHHNSNSNSGGSSPTEEGGQSHVPGATKAGGGMLIENCSPMHTASLGRHKLI